MPDYILDSLRTGSWLDSPRARILAYLNLIITVMILSALYSTINGTLDINGKPVGTDFSQVWTAGKMVLEGRAAEVWNWESHFAVQRDFHGVPDNYKYVFGWHYPPPFLIIASGLAFLPYIPALLLWQSATLIPLVMMAQRYIGARNGWLFVLAAPVTLVCLLHGHNGFLTAVLLGGGLLLLDKRPLAAGVLFGCLVYKPHFALLLPLLLLATLQWRAILGAAISSLTLIGITLLMWGWPVWQAFIASLHPTRTIVLEEGRTGWHKIMSPFSAVRSWGLDIQSAYLVQGIYTTAAIGAALWLARKGRPAHRNAAVAAAALIATPYLLDYDLVVLLLGIAFLWKDGQDHGWGNYEKTILAVAWFTPFMARSFAGATLIPIGLISMLVVLSIAVRRGVDYHLDQRYIKQI